MLAAAVRRRPRCRGESRGAAAGDRQADRRRRRAAPVRGVAVGVRSAARAGRAELLEVPRLHRPAATARSTRCSTRAASSRPPQCEIFIGAPRRRGQPGAGGRDRLPAPQRRLRDERARALEHAADDAALHRLGARRSSTPRRRYATGGVYVNFMPDDEAQRVRAGAYGPNYDRIAASRPSTTREPVPHEPERSARHAMTAPAVCRRPKPRKPTLAADPERGSARADTHEQIRPGADSTYAPCAARTASPSRW